MSPLIVVLRSGHATRRSGFAQHPPTRRARGRRSPHARAPLVIRPSSTRSSAGRMTGQRHTVLVAEGDGPAWSLPHRYRALRGPGRRPGHELPCGRDLGRAPSDQRVPSSSLADPTEHQLRAHVRVSDRYKAASAPAARDLLRRLAGNRSRAMTDGSATTGRQGIQREIRAATPSCSRPERREGRRKRSPWSWCG